MSTCLLLLLLCLASRLFFCCVQHDSPTDRTARNAIDTDEILQEYYVAEHIEHILEALDLREPPNVSAEAVQALRRQWLSVQASDSSSPFRNDVWEEDTEYGLTRRKRSIMGETLAATLQQQIIFPNKNVPDDWQGDSRRLHYYVNRISNEVKNVVLVIFVPPPDPRQYPEPIDVFELHVYKYISAGDMEVPAVFKADIPVNNSFMQTGITLEVPVTDLVLPWITRPDTNFGLYVTAHVPNGQSEINQGTKSLLNYTDSSSKPFLTINMSNGTFVAPRRRSTRICGTLAEEPKCCRRPLTINFTLFNMNYVIAPLAYNAYRCEGACSGIDPSLKLHAQLMRHVQHTLPESHSRRRGPCCAPAEYEDIKMTYTVDGATMQVRTIPNARAISCGCV